jgi:large subunit ribosomal protein L13
MKTYTPRPRDIERRWYVLDAEGVVLGRLASQAASILRGKHKPIFAPHADTGDHVIVVNAKGIVLTGQKAEKKIAYRHSGYPGGITATTYTTLLAERPSRAVEKAIRGMLPKNSLGRQMISKLQVYDGPTHPHQAQKPEPLAAGAMPIWTGLPSRPAPTAPASKPVERKAEAPATKPAAKPAAAKKTTAKKPAAKAAAAKKTTAKKPTAKAAAAKKSTAKKPAAKKSTAKRRGA